MFLIQVLHRRYVARGWRLAETTLLLVRLLVQPTLVAWADHQLFNLTQRYTLLLRELLCSFTHEQHMRTLEHLARKGDGIFDQLDIGDSTDSQSMTGHHTGIQFDLAIGGHAGTSPSIEVGIIFQ